jgi:hypothetical protein
MNVFEKYSSVCYTFGNSQLSSVAFSTHKMITIHDNVLVLRMNPSESNPVSESEDTMIVSAWTVANFNLE